MAQIIDGRALAKQVRAELKQRVSALVATHGVRPGLAVVLVGDDPASAIYVRNKTRACGRVGIDHFDHLLPASTSQEQLLELLATLNADARVHGILVQLPLPAHIDASAVLAAVDPLKDADGFHPLNLGRLMGGEPGVLPCTPAGVMKMIESTERPLQGLNALVIGRSTIVGKPMAHLLLAQHCTVTVAHSRTRDLPDQISRADLVGAAVGRPELVKGAWIRDGAIVIDVGTNRVGEGLVGDVEFSEASKRAAAISPVPRGVGPMTIAMLLQNTVDAAERTVRG
jgi:methylenetetrahydrofolate dehydrogenase (NADP+)/methenyltetrahydrofolate cyclohydrolase